MFALSIIPIKMRAGSAKDAADPSARSRIWVGACLLVLLSYSTLTVFVREAWALESFQIGVFALLGAYLLTGIRGRKETITTGWAPWLVYLIPFWGIFQLIAHTTASTFETREEVLKWGALAGVFFLIQAAGCTKDGRRMFLSAFLYFATAMAVLCLLQLPTANGRAFWTFPTGYPAVYASFAYRNNYAQFVEIALPIALWRAVRDTRLSWWYALTGSVLFASVIGSASRSGSILCTAEMLVILGIGIVRLRRGKRGVPLHRMISGLVIIPIVAAVFTFAAGWQQVWHRFERNEPFSARGYFLESAIRMTKDRPLTGFGLGTFPEVYQRYAVRDFPFYANHAHNDWAEFAADGGIPFLLLVLIPFLWVMPGAVRHPWGIGVIFVMLHACIDYPFPRPAVSAWLFAMAGLLYVTKESQGRRPAVAASKAPADHVESF
jgi:O-antigen ligase